jgi:hypothetical protein
MCKFYLAAQIPIGHFTSLVVNLSLSKDGDRHTASIAVFQYDL